MVLVYSKMECNGRVAARLYVEHYPNSHTQHHFSFAAIEVHLRQAGQFHIWTFVPGMCPSLYNTVVVPCDCYM